MLGFSASHQSKPIIDVLNYGAVADNSTDLGAAITAALTACPASGCTVRIPWGGDSGYLLSTTPSITSMTDITIDASGSNINAAVNTRFLTILNSARVRVTGLHINGTVDVNGYLGNVEQGRIVVQNSTDTEISGNTWNKTAACVFIQVGSTRTSFHDNSCLLTHAGVQTSSGAFAGLSITDNYFLGHTFNPTGNMGSDDQIAIFGNPAGHTVIARNIIDKQGPTSVNQARGINVATGSGSDTEIEVVDNQIYNVITTIGLNAKPAIDIEAASRGVNISNLIVRGNIIKNCNIPIYVAGFSTPILIDGNIIQTSTSVAGSNPNSGEGISIIPSGNGNGYTITNNIVSNTASTSINVTVANKVLIAHNQVYASGGRGISIDTSNDVIVQGNLVTGSVSHGIIVNATNRITVLGNSSINNGAYGLSLRGSRITGRISGNIFNNNNSGSIEHNTAKPGYTYGDNLGDSPPTVGGSTSPLAATACGDSVAVTVPGATTMMVAEVSPQAAVTSGLIWNAYVSAPNTVTIFYCNITTGSITPGAVKFNARVVQ
jgi:nitrous oxidase accessory protein NosD